MTKLEQMALEVYRDITGDDHVDFEELMDAEVLMFKRGFMEAVEMLESEEGYAEELAAIQSDLVCCGRDRLGWAKWLKEQVK